MGSECAFCRIVMGEEPASIVHEDDRVIAFMDIQPITPGHILVASKRHAERIADVDRASWNAVWDSVAILSGALRHAEGMRCEGVNILVADGEAAFQDVFHFHVHLIPRFEADGFSLVFPADYEQPTPRAALDTLAREIRSALPAPAEPEQYLP